MGVSPTVTDSGSRRRWLVLTAAILGWMFDGLEMGLFPLVARPALIDLLGFDKTAVGPAQEAEISQWFAIITAGFLIGAATGGVLFGWLGDRIGRVRAMTLSVLFYAGFTGLCGIAGDLYQLAIFRFLASLGMGGEWALGVALVMEMWPNRSRAWLAGVIGAAANFGYLIIAFVSLAIAAIFGTAGWRTLMFCGAVPGLLTLFIRFFVPESEKWEEERKSGATSHWQTVDLLGVLVGAVAAIGMLTLWVKASGAYVVDIPWQLRLVATIGAIAVVIAGYLFPIQRYLTRMKKSEPEYVQDQKEPSVIGRMLLGAMLSGVALLGTWGSTQWIPVWVDKATKSAMPDAKAYTQAATALGAIFGCVFAALAGERFGRRNTYFVLCLASLGSVWGFFTLNHDPEMGLRYGVGFVLISTALMTGLITAAFYGWLPLYLPELFRTNVRATGQGFGFNFGRILAAIGVMQLPIVMRELQVGYETACPMLSLIYVIGAVVIWFAPETKNRPLPERRIRV